MNKSIMNPYVLLAISIVVVALIVVNTEVGDAAAINLKLEGAQYTSLLATLFFVALIAERFVEILIGASRKPRKVYLQKLIELDATKKDEIENQLVLYRAETEKQAMTISYVVGILVALAGFRIFGALIEQPGETDFYFDTVDVILTGGIIAGGSKGVNSITRAMANFVTTPKATTAQDA